ncbi:hypothetical protein NMS86_003630 [Vibrio cholerae]|uniref:hypothetical protein n=1 Tax=Vibrio cholerae TaxID=666 RepID=UPI0015CF39A9|nr:hypothetical protein [Vibrio cholerae]EJL6361209.1 hypothetical protein [Vibrio cholerae]EJL6861081.1 hypothetical protein [Vibrio cholerae]EKF9441624.1 hypothetical protein [Vibrio cholerae]MDA5319746.1 hypothetical protein [Vibrio cholerae]UIP02209.1 hypothetical protein LY388_05150 [Vibrio cholerae]
MTLEKYEKAIASWAVEKVKPIGQAMLAGEMPEGYKTDYFPMLLDGFKGVFDSFEAMKFSLTLLKSDFPISESVSREKYLEYVVHAFYSDCYVLKELLKGYTNRIQKVYSRTLPNESVKLRLEPVFDALSNDIEPLMNIRNSHVHQERFQGGGLSQLSGLSLAAQYEDSLANANDEAFKAILNQWVKYFERVIGIYTGFLDECFDHISEIVLENGAVREP